MILLRRVRPCGRIFSLHGLQPLVICLKLEFYTLHIASKGGPEYEAGFRGFSATAAVTPTGSKKAAEITKTEVMFSKIPSKAGERISGYLNIYQDTKAHRVNFSLNTSPCE